MSIKLWWCESMKKWRYTITETSRPILKQFSGQNDTLSETLKEIEKQVSSINKL